MFRPLVIPEEFVPIEITPVNEGASTTLVPAAGVNKSSGVADEYSCTVIRTVVPTSATAFEVLKYAAIAVIVPSRGMEHA